MTDGMPTAAWTPSTTHPQDTYCKEGSTPQYTGREEDLLSGGKRESVLENQPHSDHTDAAGMLLAAEKSVLWPKMAETITDKVFSCPKCNLRSVIAPQCSRAEAPVTQIQLVKGPDTQHNMAAMFEGLCTYHSS
jgi:hypothetical protein